MGTHISRWKKCQNPHKIGGEIGAKSWRVLCIAFIIIRLNFKVYIIGLIWSSGFKIKGEDGQRSTTSTKTKRSEPHMAIGSTDLLVKRIKSAPNLNDCLIGTWPWTDVASSWLTESLSQSLFESSAMEIQTGDSEEGAVSGLRWNTMSSCGFNSVTY